VKLTSLTLREKHRLRVFENRVLKGMFGPKKDELTGGWRKLQNEEFRNFYPSPSIIRVIKSSSMKQYVSTATATTTRSSGGGGGGAATTDVLVLLIVFEDLPQIFWNCSFSPATVSET
jgi:hypothetical protein